MHKVRLRTLQGLLQASIKHANEGCYNAADECLQQVTFTIIHFWQLPVTKTLSKAHLCLAPTMQVNRHRRSSKVHAQKQWLHNCLHSQTILPHIRFGLASASTSASMCQMVSFPPTGGSTKTHHTDPPRRRYDLPSGEATPPYSLPWPTPLCPQLGGDAPLA